MVFSSWAVLLSLRVMCDSKVIPLVRTNPSGHFHPNSPWIIASILVLGVGLLAPMPAGCFCECVGQICLTVLEMCLAWPSIGCSVAKEAHTCYFLRAGGLGSLRLATE